MGKELKHQKTYFEPFSETSGLTIGSNRPQWGECKKILNSNSDCQYLFVKTENTLFGSKGGWAVGLTHKDAKDLHEYLGRIIQYMEGK